ncbi:hypothetical protein DIPPA_14115 [Diplonema papillatum]|nr:hypothetical protein DIPPA_14115 [Diplonema papillatum]
MLTGKSQTLVNKMMRPPRLTTKPEMQTRMMSKMSQMQVVMSTKLTLLIPVVKKSMLMLMLRMQIHKQMQTFRTSRREQTKGSTMAKQGKIKRLSAKIAKSNRSKERKNKPRQSRCKTAPQGKQ